MTGEPPPIDADLLMQAHLLAFKESHGRLPSSIHISFDLFFALVKGKHLDPCDEPAAVEGQDEDETAQECFTYHGIDLQFGPEEGWTMYSPINPPELINWEAILQTPP